MNVLPKKQSTIASALLLGTALTGASAMSRTNHRPCRTRLHGDTVGQDLCPERRVDHRKVTFKNRYGLTLVADLYLPKNRGNAKLAAIAVSGLPAR